MFEDNHIDNMCIEDDPNLSPEENRIRKDIIMDEVKERARIENPKLYKFVYVDQGEVPGIPNTLNFALVDSFIKNSQYILLPKVKHNFEQA